MRSSGTTQATIRKRQAGRAKATRLRILTRRFGLIVFFGLGLAWLSAWVLLSGVGARYTHVVAQNFYHAAADKGLAVQNIYVQGRENTDPNMLRALLDIDKGDPILAFDPEEARELIKRISWVKEVEVARYLPDTIYIDMRERQPLALWQHKGKVRLIDDEGVTLATSQIKKFPGLLLLVGEEAPVHAADLVQTLEAEPSVRQRIEAASWIGDRRWNLKLKNGVEVKLPENDLGLALRRLAMAQEQDGLLDKDIKMIDARNPAKMTVETQPGAVVPYEAGSESSI